MAIVPVKLAAIGNESALSFSMTYDSRVLSNPQVTLGADAASVSLVVNTQQTGRVGMMLYLNAGQTFAAGDWELVRMAFAISASAPMGATPIGFTDTPAARDVSDAQGNSLPVGWVDGVVRIVSGYEADVAPRPNGDERVTAVDVIQVARFVVGLDTPTGSEFMRADCAPRTSLGDGIPTASDIAQAVRYVVGLDPLTPVGGPACMIMNGPAVREIFRIQNRKLNAGDHNVRVVSATGEVGGMAIVPVKLAVMGDESAVSFSMTYDSTVLSNPRVILGTDAASASLVVNTQQTGRIGVALWLNAGQTFTTGDRDLVRVVFSIAVSAPTGATPIVFAGMSTVQTMSDSLGNLLPVTWVDGLVNIIGKRDSDGDGMSDWAEFIAGTDSTNKNSYLEIEFPVSGVYVLSGDGIVVQWHSISNRFYHLYRSTNLNSGFEQLFPINIEATPTLNTYTDTIATGNSPYFYKVGVEWKP